MFFYYWKQKHACIKCVCQMDEGITKVLSTPETQPLTAHQQSLYDSTSNWTHTCRSPSKHPPPPWPPPSAFHVRHNWSWPWEHKMSLADGLHCPSLSRVCHLQGGKEYYKVHWVGSGCVERWLRVASGLLSVPTTRCVWSVLQFSSAGIRSSFLTMFLRYLDFFF